MADNTDTLDSIIKRYINEKGEVSKHGYQRYLQIAIDGLDDLDMDVSGQPTFLLCEVDDQATIPIPPDNIRIINIAFSTQGGEWVYFAKNNQQKMAVDYECGTPDFGANDLSANDLANVAGFNGFGYTSESYSNHFRNGEQTGAYYNLPGGNSYTYRVNEAQGSIELSSNTPSKVILEYLPTSKQVDGQYRVHPYLRQALIAYLNFASIRSKSSSSNNDIMAKKRMYTKAKMWAKKQFTSFSKADFLDSFRKTYRQTPKF